MRGPDDEKFMVILVAILLVLVVTLVLYSAVQAF